MGGLIVLEVNKVCIVQLWGQYVKKEDSRVVSVECSQLITQKYF